VPKLWNETIAEHRRSVREAVLDAATALVVSKGLASVTMSKIAEDSGIGRATLYKYFPDIQSILLAWHERQVANHLDQLTQIRDQVVERGDRLGAVLEAFALMAHQRHDGELAALLHRGPHMARAHRRLSELIRDLLAESAARGEIRDDIAPDELAAYCLHALTAASGSRSKAAVRRLVDVTLAGLRRAV
jgi:AcrR family transcriptional regulator